MSNKSRLIYDLRAAVAASAGPDDLREICARAFTAAAARGTPIQLKPGELNASVYGKQANLRLTLPVCPMCAPWHWLCVRVLRVAEWITRKPAAAPNPEAEVAPPPALGPQRVPHG